ncbi:hypothetical protein PC129_g15629 [Phytophthora cactorum]|uniref:Uncharacterized protein n=1 Tax=Phytophthora cactorum TaxID=29920 RepID=A0A329RN41_9STRA|nr:hypothetical protein Pcac1_g7340 [Phytophthora cactorum]KAG2810016.1 hypothetical protein PC111_g15824 [Phytophthora cactorum]KAG2813318.1 hypothetical protein PC112_g14789 [Phytophthora cactorum]KAG2852511.1 hypothetical protein PC113_g14962 [Phytophthora cactorum]KAG2895341.1 hypothetical protein PC114_g15521 [Phytophthora cactorum]
MAGDAEDGGNPLLSLVNLLQPTHNRFKADIKMEAVPDCRLIQPAMKPQRMMMQDSPNRQWAGNCGCDGSCAFQFFNDDMELVDVRSKPVEEKQVEESSPPLILHLLLMW